MRRERRSAKQPSDVRGACVGLRERLADSPIAARLDLVPATLPLRRLIDCLRVSVGKLEATRSDAFLGWFLTFLRHVNGLPHTSQSFVGRFSFLTPRGMARDHRRVCDPPTLRAPINTARKVAARPSSVCSLCSLLALGEHRVSKTQCLWVKIG